MKGLEMAFETWVLTYLLNSLWQVPLVFLAALAAARLARPAGPRMVHRVWVGALLLEAVLPLCNLRPSEVWQRAWGLALEFMHGSAGDGQTRVVLGAGTTSQVALPWLTAGVLTAVAVAYVCGLVYFAGRLGWGVWTTEAMRRRAMPFEPAGETATKTARFRRMLGKGTSQSEAEVHFASSTDISGPATVGLRRKTLLLPPAFLDKLSAEDLDAVLAHELAHIERWDFAKNLLYGVLTLPVAYHPLLSLTRKRLAETRELVCDVMAAEAVGGRESYARSLLRLARMLSDRPAPRVLHAIGIFDANIFERRVMQLSRRSLEIKGGRRFAISAACVLVGLVTCTSALALRMDVNSPSSSQQNTKTLKIDAKEAQANILTKVPPAYPDDAKKARVTGSVVLEAMIGKDGTVENLKVVSGPSMLQQSAMDAVRQWTYKPYLLNGDPVEIKTKITVVYSLSK
jgi:TonB family protein